MRTMTRIITTAAIAVTALGIAAPAAQAGVNPTFISVSPVGSACVLSANSVTGNPGSVFYLLVHKDCKVLFLDATAAPVTPGFRSGLSGDAQAFTMTSLGSGPIVLSDIEYIPTKGATPGGNINVSVVDTNVVSPTAVIHDDLQQVGVPASGDCDDVPAYVGHYAGFPIGGWSKSWAMWINDGKGGPVCTRELEELPNGTVVLVG